MTCGRFPHSEIPGSILVLRSPRLIAESYVLHRYWLSRHPLLVPLLTFLCIDLTSNRCSIAIYVVYNFYSFLLCKQERKICIYSKKKMNFLFTRKIDFSSLSQIVNWKFKCKVSSRPLLCLGQRKLPRISFPTFLTEETSVSCLTVPYYIASILKTQDFFSRFLLNF